MSVEVFDTLSAANNSGFWDIPTPTSWGFDLDDAIVIVSDGVIQVRAIAYEYLPALEIALYTNRLAGRFLHGYNVTFSGTSPEGAVGLGFFPAGHGPILNSYDTSGSVNEISASPRFDSPYLLTAGYYFATLSSGYTANGYAYKPSLTVTKLELLLDQQAPTPFWTGYNLTRENPI